MPNRPTVFIVNRGNHDYSQAETFGVVQALSEGHLNRFHTTNMARLFSAALANSSKEDFILVGGPVIAVAIACAIFTLKHQRLNLLIWQPDDELGGRYICRKTVFAGETYESNIGDVDGTPERS